MARELGLRLILEKGVVQLAIVNVDFANLGANLLSHFGFESFFRILDGRENVPKLFTSPTDKAITPFAKSAQAE